MFVYYRQTAFIWALVYQPYVKTGKRTRGSRRDVSKRDGSERGGSERDRADLKGTGRVGTGQGGSERDETFTVQHLELTTLTSIRLLVRSSFTFLKHRSNDHLPSRVPRTLRCGPRQDGFYCCCRGSWRYSSSCCSWGYCCCCCCWYCAVTFALADCSLLSTRRLLDEDRCNLCTQRRRTNRSRCERCIRARARVSVHWNKTGTT